jgi:hypothetical protein
MDSHTVLLLLTLMTAVIATSSAPVFLSVPCGRTCINSCCRAELEPAAAWPVETGRCLALSGSWDGGGGYPGGAFQSFRVTVVQGNTMSIAWYLDTSCTTAIELGPSDPAGCPFAMCCSFMFEHTKVRLPSCSRHC